MRSNTIQETKFVPPLKHCARSMMKRPTRSHHRDRRKLCGFTYYYVTRIHAYANKSLVLYPCICNTGYTQGRNWVFPPLRSSIFLLKKEEKRYNNEKALINYSEFSIYRFRENLGTWFFYSGSSKKRRYFQPCFMIQNFF